MCQNLVTELSRLQRSWVLVIALLSMCLAAPAKAADLEAFHRGLEGVNRPYTSALFYLRTGNTALAGLDLMAALSRWKGFAKQYEASPPAPYDKDEDWQKTLLSVAGAFEAGAAKIESGDGKGARETLLPIKTLLYELRERNGQRVLADCIFDLTGQMDALYYYRRNPPDLENQAIQDKLLRMGREYLIRLVECRELASEPLRQNKDFQSLFGGAEKSVKSIVRPVNAKDQRAVINVLRELVSFDRLIWLRWG